MQKFTTNDGFTINQRLIHQNLTIIKSLILLAFIKYFVLHLWQNYTIIMFYIPLTPEKMLPVLQKSTLSSLFDSIHISTNLDIKGYLVFKLEQTGMHHITFITRHSDGKEKRDDKARWWLDWHIYSMDDNNSIICGHRILFHLLLRSDKTHNNVILWTDYTSLGGVTYVLVGPFKFATKANNIRSNQVIYRNIWDELVATCIKAGAIGSILSNTSTFYNR